MKRLPQMIILMRHGLAVESDEWDGSDDERPLTTAGKKKAVQACAGLLAEYVPTLVVTSELVRAMQTADAFDVACAADGLEHRHRMCTNALHHSSNFTVWKKYLEETMVGRDSEEIFLAIGHEPSISRLMAGHLGLKAPVFGFKKAGVAVLRPLDSFDHCELVAFIPPKLLRGVGA